MTKSIRRSNLAIACAAGGYRGAFSHGVLAALERAGLRAATYSAASSTVLPTAYAAVGGVERLEGADYWKHGWRVFQELGSMSRSYDQGLEQYGPWLKGALFTPEAARMIIPANKVVTQPAADRTQSKQFLRLGREQLLAIRSQDASWAEDNLELHWFDSKPRGEHRPLTPENMIEVFYASSRYLHGAWDRPAWIDGEPYVDAVYTAAVPVQALRRNGVEHIIVIHHDPDWPSLDFYRSQPLPKDPKGVEFHVIGPEGELSAIGIEVMNATEQGLTEAHELGLNRGRQWLESHAEMIEAVIF